SGGADSARGGCQARIPAKWVPDTFPTSEHLGRVRLRRLAAAVAVRDEVPRDHLVIREARADHRIDARFGIDDDLEERRAVVGEKLLEHALDVALVVEALRPLEAVRLRGLDEVLLAQR